ncbi:MAG: NAD(P)/FAD-dependent oxidoreductase [Acidobacteriota bacterium]
MRDVAVIGGGPGGLVAAEQLAASGFRVAVFEEHQEIGCPVHCTGVLADEALAELRLPVGSVLNPLSTVRFVGPGGASFAYTTPSVEAVVIDRHTFDAALSDQAVRAGAELERGRRVEQIDTGPDGVTLTFAGGAVVRARAAILACGASYGIQRRLGMGMPHKFLQSAQLEVPADRLGDVEVHFGSEIAPRGFAWAVPVRRPTGTFARVGVMADSDAGLFFKRMVERLRDRWGLDVPEGAQPRRRMLPLGSIRRTYADRLLAVGDAAGLVKPTTGGGIYYSIVSGRTAADVLGEKLATGDLGQASLREYERRWRARFQPEFAAQLALRALAERLSDADIQTLFDLASTDGILPLVRRTARFNRHRDFIMALFKHGGARRVLFNRLASSAAR